MKELTELTIEEKAQRFDEVIEGIQEILSSRQDSIKMSRLQLRLQGIFPELKESEDERIRKMIINTLNRDKILTEDEAYDCVAWLKKQGEKKHAWSKEDEKNLEKTIWYVEKGGKLIFAETDKLVSWLKSLKDRVGCEAKCTTMWKPSGEQMKFLWKYAEQNNYDGRILTSLYQDLKKLREG